jgi:nitroreductase
VNLVYVLNAKSPKDSFVPNSRDKYVEVGCLAQNVYLYCASQGLAATARGGVDQKKFSEVIKAKPEQIALAQTIRISEIKLGWALIYQIAGNVLVLARMGLHYELFK